MKRLFLNELKDHFNEEVTISGFVDSIRNLQWVQFIVLKDETGKVQITVEKSLEENKELVNIIDNLFIKIDILKFKISIVHLGNYLYFTIIIFILLLNCHYIDIL